MAEHAPVEITVRETAGVHFVEVRGRLTIGEPSERLNDELQALLQRGARKVIANLNGIPQIDSSGISVLVRISMALVREGGALHLVCGMGRVRDALIITRLIEAIPTFDTEAAALAGFS
jgi:anti-anti-sigma factor